MKNLLLIALIPLFFACGNASENDNNSEKKDAADTELKEEANKSGESGEIKMAANRKEFFDLFTEVKSMEALMKGESGEIIIHHFTELKGWSPKEEEFIAGPFSPVMGMGSMGKLSKGDYWLMMADYSTPRAMGSTLFAVNKKTLEVTDGIHFSNSSGGMDGSEYVMETTISGDDFKTVGLDKDPDGKVKSKTESIVTFNPDKGTFDKK
jgi:hypothetical protein